jgi:hypothetical protein
MNNEVICVATLASNSIGCEYGFDQSLTKTFNGLQAAGSHERLSSGFSRFGQSGWKRWRFSTHLTWR